MERETTPFRTCLRADWRDVVFVHYAIDPEILQPHVPWALDLFEGRAWVTLVAFRQCRLRPGVGGQLAEWAMRPVGKHAFLNLRTYVRCADGRAICFLVEWIPNLLARLVGPRLYGLPFRLGRLEYGEERREVRAGGRSFCARVAETPAVPSAAREGTLEHFLVERYTAFAHERGRARRFDIRHRPWDIAPAEVTVEADSLIRAAAPWFAHARFVRAHTSPGVCDVEISGPRGVETRREERVGRAWPLAMLPLLWAMGTLGVRGRLPAWGFMWAMALAIYAGCKLATWIGTRPHTGGWIRTLAYLVAWPGMDARSFLDGVATEGRRLSELVDPIGRVLAGLMLYLIVAPAVPAGHPLLVGWMGLAGMVLVLHFGLFDLLACAWAAVGWRATPIMRAPWRARSLGEFWGTRWNRGFRDLAHEWIFGPLRKTLGVGGATFAVFLVSGLVHDLIISLPAGGGFGGPTVYFLLQYLGIAVEKSATGRGRLRGRVGRLFALLCVVGPLPLLFHAAFVTRVMAPFVRAVGSILNIHVMETPMRLETLILIGGLLHLSLLTAGATAAKVLDWRHELHRLCPLSRHMIWTHGAFIVMTIIAFGVISLCNAGDLAAGRGTARWFCGFVAAFWMTRLFVQFFLFDPKPHLTHPLLAVGYHSLTVVFTYLTVVYGYAAVG
jgi:alginate O-acetyltransferase complex protein AlgI